MKRTFFLLFLLIATSVWAGQKFNAQSGKTDFCVSIEEEDGSPKNTSCQKVKVSNGNLTDNGDGTFSLADQTSAGGGSSSIVIQVDDANTATQASTLDFGLYFSGSESPANEANVTLDFLNPTTNSATATSGNLLVADGLYFAGVTLSGDATITKAGVINLAADTVGTNELTFINSSTATAGFLLIADGVGFNAIAASGDATISSAGAVTVANASHTHTASNISDQNAGTDITADLEEETHATEHQDTGADEVAVTGGMINSDLGDITCDGTATGCNIDTGVVSTAEIATDGVGAAEIAADAVGISEIDFINSATATSGRLLIADGAQFNSVAMSGDTTILSTGTVAIGADKVTEAMLKAVDSAVDEECLSYETTTGDFEWQTCGSGSSALVDLTDVNSATASSGRVLVADGSAWHSAVVGGDCTMAWNGTMSCTGGSGATTLVDLADVNSATPTSGRILIADGGQFNSMAASGDVTITSIGVTAIGANTVALTTDTTGNYVTSITNGAGISGGDGGSEGAALTIAATLGTAITSSEITDGEIVAADTAFLNSTTATAGYLLIADGEGFNSFAAGGDCTVSSIGVFSCTGGSGATTLVDLADVNSATATSGNILFADGSNFISGTMLGQIHFPPYSVKLTGSYVTDTPSGGDRASQGAAIEGGDGAWKVLFDATTDEAVVWQWKLPDDWSGHHSVIYPYSMASATANEVEWECAVKCSGEGINVDSVGGFVSDTNTVVTVPATAGFIDYATFDLSDANTGTCSAGNLIWFQASTDADDASGNDDSTGDRELLSPIYNYFRKAR